MLWRRRNRADSPVAEAAQIYGYGNELLARSILDATNIPYAVIGLFSQDFFGWGRFGFGYNQTIGPLRIWTRREDVDATKKLLADVINTPPSATPDWIRWIARIALAENVLVFLYVSLIK